MAYRICEFFKYRYGYIIIRSRDEENLKCNFISKKIYKSILIERLILFVVNALIYYFTL